MLSAVATACNCDHCWSLTNFETTFGYISPT